MDEFRVLEHIVTLLDAVATGNFPLYDEVQSLLLSREYWQNPVFVRARQLVESIHGMYDQQPAPKESPND